MPSEPPIGATSSRPAASVHPENQYIDNSILQAYCFSRSLFAHRIMPREVDYVVIGRSWKEVARYE
jgi:hypothetical protein